MYRSLNVPGSPSSPFTTRYLGFGLFLGMNDHFLAVGNPAPPRPRRFERETSSMICSGVRESAFFAATYPPLATYASHHVPSAFLQPRRNHRTIGGDERLRLATGVARLARRSVAGRREGGLRDVRSASRRIASRVPGSLRGPTNCSSSCAIGAISHAHRHSTSVTVSSPPCGRFTRANPQSLFDADEHIVCPAQQARQARADAKLAPARRLRAEHRVEGNDLAHVGDRDAQMASDPELRLGRNMTELPLHQPQERQHRRPWLVVSLDDFPCVRVELCEIHRSSSPPIMLTDPNVGVRSAIMSPTRSLGRADMMAKHGGRTRTRYALLLPSLTT